MKTQDVYLKFESVNKEYYHFSIDHLLDYGNPIDEDGVDMEQVDDNSYVFHKICSETGEFKLLLNFF